MSIAIIFVLMAAAAAYVVLPLLRHGRRPGPILLAVAAGPVVIDGVAYDSEEEWAVDRAMRRAGDGEPRPRTYRGQAELEADIEKGVAALRRRRRADRAVPRRPLCPRCGKPFQAGDQFCARCGEAHPSLCPQCGERHKPGDRFCTCCGTMLLAGAER